MSDRSLEAKQDWQRRIEIIRSQMQGSACRKHEHYRELWAADRIALLEKVATTAEQFIIEECIEYIPLWDALYEAGYLEEGK